MTTINSNKQVKEIYDMSDKERCSEKLNIKKMYHHSSTSSIDSIEKTRCMWFTNLTKQNTEKPFNDNEDCDTFFITCFSRKLFSKKEINENNFKGRDKYGIDTALEFSFDDINKIFDKNKCCKIVLKNHEQYDIKFEGSSSSIYNEASGSDYLNTVFAEISILVPDYKKTTSESDNANEDKARPTKLVLEENNDTFTIANNVGSTVKDDFMWQDEIRFVISLKSAKQGGVKIEDIVRVEVFLSNDVDLKKIDLK